MQGQGVPGPPPPPAPAWGPRQATKPHIVVTAAGRGVTGTPESFQPGRVHSRWRKPLSSIPVLPGPMHLWARVTPSHPGALGSLPRAASVPGAGRALGSRTSCQRSKEELDDNGGGGEPGCQLMNNAMASLSGAADFLFTNTRLEPAGWWCRGADPGAPQLRALLPHLPPPNTPFPGTHCPQQPCGAGSGHPGAEGLSLVQGVCTPPWGTF